MNSNNKYPHLFNVEDNIFFRQLTGKPIVTHKLIVEFLEQKTDFWEKISGSMRFLDIGCGTGELTLLLLDYFSKRANIDAVFLDPLKQALEITQIRLQGHRSLQSGSGKKQYVRDKFESFYSDYSEKGQMGFNFVLCSHTMYYFQNWEQEIQHALSLLCDGGLCCIVLKSRTGVDAFDLRDKVYNVLGITSQEQYEFSEDMETLLTGLDVEFRTVILEYDAVFPSNRKALDERFPDVLRILRFIYHVPLEQHITNPDISRYYKEFIHRNTVGNVLCIRLKDHIFFLSKQE